MTSLNPTPSNLYVVVNPKDGELGRGYDRSGIQAWVTDHIMILDDHDQYMVKTYKIEVSPILGEKGQKLYQAAFEYMQTPETFIKED